MAEPGKDGHGTGVESSPQQASSDSDSVLGDNGNDIAIECDDVEQLTVDVSPGIPERKTPTKTNRKRISFLHNDVESQHGAPSPRMTRSEHELSQWKLTVHPLEGLPRDVTFTFYSVKNQSTGSRIKRVHPSSAPLLIRSPSNSRLLTPTFDNESGTMTQHNVVCRIRDNSELIAQFDVDDVTTVRENYSYDVWLP